MQLQSPSLTSSLLLILQRKLHCQNVLLNPPRAIGGLGGVRDVGVVVVAVLVVGVMLNCSVIKPIHRVRQLSSRIPSRIPNSTCQQINFQAEFQIPIKHASYHLVDLAFPHRFSYGVILDLLRHSENYILFVL